MAKAHFREITPKKVAHVLDKPFTKGITRCLQTPGDFARLFSGLELELKEGDMNLEAVRTAIEEAMAANGIVKSEEPKKHAWVDEFHRRIIGKPAPYACYGPENYR